METKMRTGPIEVEVVLRVRVDPAVWVRDHGGLIEGVPERVREHFVEHADTSRIVTCSRGQVVVL